MDTIRTKILNAGFIPIFSHEDLQVCKQVIKACYEGGLRVFEFTNRTTNAFEVFSELQKYTKKEMPEMSLGIGTILDAKMTEIAVEAGADFIVSPIISIDVSTTCKNANKLWIPGCMTMTEVVSAYQSGASFVKIFPASIVTPKFLQYCKELFPQIKLMPTGGVESTEESLKMWYNAGASVVGIGGKFFKLDFGDPKSYSDLSSHVKGTLEIINKIKVQN